MRWLGDRGHARRGAVGVPPVEARGGRGTQSRSPVAVAGVGLRLDGESHFCSLGFPSLTAVLDAIKDARQEARAAAGAAVLRILDGASAAASGGGALAESARGTQESDDASDLHDVLGMLTELRR